MIVETEFTLQELWDTAMKPKSVMTVAEHECLEQDLRTLSTMYEPSLSAAQMEFVRNILPGLLRRRVAYTRDFLKAIDIPLSTKLTHSTRPWSPC